MGNFSFWEILLIFLAILLLFGARRIPEIAGSLGKGIREFKRSVGEVERSINEPERPAPRLHADQSLGVRPDVPPQPEEEQQGPRRLLS